MTKGVIITGSRWNVLSDAATFPSWYFHEALKNRVDFEIWAEEVIESEQPNVHSLRNAIPATISDRLGLLRRCFFSSWKREEFSPALIAACEQADFISLFFPGGNALTDCVLSNWGRKSTHHLTDNAVLIYLRSRNFRFAMRALLEHIHCSRMPSRNVIFVSETDKKWFANMFPWRRKDTHAVPLGVDTELFHPAPDDEVPQRSRCRFLFAGDLSYDPNAQACRYIIDHILPALPEDVAMVFGGRRPPSFVSRAAESDKRIQITGFVEDMSAVYRNCDVMLAPIFRGAGMQNKLLEASASGLPCITTPVCAKAFPTRPPNFLVAGDPNGLISHAIEMNSNSEHRKFLGKKGRDHIKSNYSWDERAETVLKLALPL